MNCKKKGWQRGPGKKRTMKFFIIFQSIAFLTILSFYGCSSKPQSPPATTSQTQSKTRPRPAAPPKAAIEETPVQEGYIYQQRERRDPFIPLIVPRKKVKKGAGAKVGTLESYDISDFTLAAIAKKGREYFALLTTPDNRSFTVNKGNIIGLNKGKVKEITRDRIVLVEYSRDYMGKLKPREIILEFHKGEVE
ncbi:MAG TPA: hypothetical protein ENG83_08055 [Nitrospirae bacterium]|nr:Pilus assembly protein, PilP [bacterium BMS3Abin06]HDH12134.1 hypothetical protein [Nitrospirota bacterium]HDZ02360.1 hypothetical protein [Nitrospirota bacterium]